VTSVTSSVYPHVGVCANCGRERDDLFWHRGDEVFYCADVLRCEARLEILEARDRKIVAARPWAASSQPGSDA
jgi:hypothetical protein